MKLEDQTCAIQYSKRLCELGVKQESLFYWEKCPMQDEDDLLYSLHYYDMHEMWTNEFNDCHDLKDQEHYSAFTVGELWEQLPQNIILVSKKNREYSLQINKEESKWKIDYCYSDWAYDDNLISYKDEIDDLNLANSMAKMRIYLLENGLMELPK